ncbi:putative acyl-CoA dehydrogenase FadE [Nocardia neocaledoniensis NBRC 108232]|uniref:Alkylation response protein AidB-like acyl-CoA dehydrogenase n=1 Tax=Nocardia neocaledoniensis TaxID=236511 RepID=A0A317NJL7_9NOCA|nr:acyl-CoA dehydrogenase [Nocardia neocaledoniensis]PWV75087.1 alkylation response protein AidB-like acyl-CoA dehydrogenase [Nocardia neocaledoniensis]GEM31810.1 putative acyl-CoA dehydrogenase FadE [Nocardia neocaledoniensis NBRC 108232]
MARTSYALGVGVSEDHAALAQAVSGFVERTITSETVRAAVESGDAGKLPHWDALVAQELLSVHVAEDLGGQGAGLLTLAVALEPLGRGLHTGPFVPTALASAVLAQAGGTWARAQLPGLTDGSRTGAVALSSALTGVRRDGVLVVDGHADGVIGALGADIVLAPVEIDGDRRWVAFENAELTVTAQDNVDVLRGTARLHADSVSVPADRVLDTSPTRVRSLAAVIFGAEAVGVMSWCVSTAAEYAKTRVQFGRPIGQFQGVKHKCAHMGIALEKARAVLWDAAYALDRDDDTADYAAAIAALIVPDAAVEVAQDCIQVHGGIGFTWEHDAHLYYRRALALRGQLGGRDERAEAVAGYALSGVTLSTELELPGEAERIRADIRAELAEIAAIDDEDDQLVALGDGGWNLPHLPRPYGRSASPLEQVVISQEVKASGIPMPQLLMGTWAVGALVPHGDERQKRELVVPTLRGEVVWCQLFSEPGAGSDLASLTTKAVKVDGGWRVTGQKIWTTVAQFAQWAMLIARTNPDKPKHEGITYFVLDMASPGITVRPLREMTGSALFNEVFLDEVFIPDENVVGAVDDGWHVARTTLAGERVALSQKMEAYATDTDLLRFAIGRELSPVARHRIGELMAESRAVDVIGSRVVLKQLSGIDVSTTSSVGKLLGMALGQAISEFIVAELGVAGVVSVPGERSDHAMEQLIAGRATTIYGGTTEVQLNVIGERMLGLPRDAAAGT